ncbi:hypothetical protein [Rhodococcus globerulus]|uniref:hypothetical protein n=1 Tax=Rhodococcus globerulus TaxID=33008 RepID=UPI001C5A33E1|nr:hypothetical protein [Rhodococcus globerulus]QXW04429.1 hypothetical protein KYT97_10600 [Rhodococcus globerulus]
MSLHGVVADGLALVASVPGRVADVALAPTAVLQHFTDDRGEFDDTIAEASKVADLEREVNWAIRDALTPRATALEYSEHAIIEDDPFDAMSHAQIFAHVDEMKPDILVAISKAWTEISERVVNGISAFNLAVGSAIGDGWQGKGGSAALEAVLAYSADGQELQTRVQLVANKVEEAKIALGQAKQSIPRPSDASLGEQLISMIPGESWRQAQHEAEEAERLARQVMKEMYLPYMKRADDQVPVLPPAFNPITSGGGTSGGRSPFQTGTDQMSYEQAASAAGNYQTSGGGSGLEQRTADSPGGAGTDPTVGGAGNGASAGGSGATPGAALGDSGRVSGSGIGRSESGSGPATTSAASAVPQSVGSGSIPGVGHGAGLGGGTGLTGGPGSGGFGGGGSAGGAGGGIAGGGSGANGLGGSGLGGSGLGGSVAGGGLGSAGGSGARGGAAGSLGAAGSRGMMAGGMGGMAGGRGQGDDDKMHETPGYLITLDNGNELIGDLPMVTPPVLGQ